MPPTFKNERQRERKRERNTLKFIWVKERKKERKKESKKERKKVRNKETKKQRKKGIKRSFEWGSQRNKEKTNKMKYTNNQINPFKNKRYEWLHFWFKGAIFFSSYIQMREW